MIHRKSQQDERGSILVLSTVRLVIALIFGGLAIDLGFIAQEARRNQKVADMAALDSVRVLPTDPTTAAIESAARNNFLDTANILTEWGPTKTGPWTSSAAGLADAKAVRVTIRSVHDNQFPFLSDGQNVIRRAIAEKKDIAGFTIGSSLLTFNSSSSALLNPILSRWLGGTVNLSALSYQGLAAGHVSLEALRFQLASMGVAAGTVDQMLTSDITLAQFYRATAQALAANGQTANATIFDTLRIQAISTTTFKLGEMVKIGQGGSDSAGSAQLNLFQLLTGSATAANGQNLISVNNVNITVPNTASVDMTLRVIEGPKTYIGPVGNSVSTGQIALTITPRINALNLLGLVNVTGTAPIDLTAAGATGTLKSIACPSKDIVVTADPVAIDASSKTTTLAVTTLVGLPLLDVNVSAARSAIDEPATDLPFAYDAEFNPPNQYSKTAGSSMVGLEAATNTTGTPANVNALGLLSIGLGAGTITSAVVNLVDTLIGDIDELVVTPLLNSLGLDMGAADVTALGYDPVTGLGLPQCGLPTLAG